MTMAQIRQPAFPLNIVASKALDPRDLQGNDRAALQSALLKVFGTPADPTVEVPKKADGNPETGWEEVAETLTQAQTDLKLDKGTLRLGSQLYRIHCLHCHGLAGDGRGPTAFWINPHPRDYRLGIYKFTSTALGGTIRPQRADLHRTLKSGIEGTAMPAFNLLPEHELDAMVSYVIHLSLRGQVELQMMTYVLSKTLEGDFDESIRNTIRGFTTQWINAQGKLLAVPEYPYTEKDLEASVKRGFGYWREWQCYVCHMDYGRTASFNYDFWGTLTRPANVTIGSFRGGRRPLDLYWRVLGGVNGAGMPANDNRVGGHPKVQGKNDQIWDVVNFLQVLPYRSMRDKYGIQID
jgi:mono/diheme cytochrome c family protein